MKARRSVKAMAQARAARGVEVESVECPACGAKPRHSCKGPGGRLRRLAHRGRELELEARRAAAKKASKKHAPSTMDGRTVCGATGEIAATLEQVTCSTCGRMVETSPSLAPAAWRTATLPGVAPRPSSSSSSTPSGSSIQAAAPVNLLAPAFAVAREVRARVELEGHVAVKALYTWFDELNREHFGGKLPPATILLASTGSPRALGDHARVDEHGIHYVVRINPACLRRGERFVRDVLLHELVHVAQGHDDPEDTEKGYRGHGPKFAARCNAIGKTLGLPDVAPRGRGAPDCAQWPVNVRPAGYYPPVEERRRPAPRARPEPEQDAGDAGDAGEDGGRDRGGELAELRELAATYEKAMREALELLEDDKDFTASSAAGLLREALEAGPD